LREGLGYCSLHKDKRNNQLTILLHFVPEEGLCLTKIEVRLQQTIVMDPSFQGMFLRSLLNQHYSTGSSVTFPAASNATDPDSRPFMADSGFPEAERGPLSARRQQLMQVLGQQQPQYQFQYAEYQPNLDDVLALRQEEHTRHSAPALYYPGLLHGIGPAYYHGASQPYVFPRSMPSVITNDRLNRTTWSQSADLETIDLTEEDNTGLPCQASKLLNNLEGKLLHNDVVELLQHQCPICLDTYRDILKHIKLYTTYCGHIFCRKCIYSSLNVSKQCPTCRTLLNGNDSVHPLYLPFL